MSAAYARSDFNDEILHHRDGTLVKRKREQWAKERAELDSWFPFGSPGGGAPNRKYETNNSAQLDKTDNRPSSCRSNGDSGRWSDSENVGPGKEVQEQDSRRPDFAYPYMAASTSSAASTIYIPSPSQVVDASAYHGLPNLTAPTPSFVPPANVSIPVQFLCSPGAYGQAMPVPIDVAQPSSAAFSCVYPIRLVPTASANCSAAQVGADDQGPEMSSLSTSYTEHWANQLPYWGANGVRKEDPLSPVEVNPMNFPTISNAQPLAVVRPMMIPVVAPSRSDQQFSPAHRSDSTHKSMSGSSTSLDSSYRRGMDSENKGQTLISEQIINEQIAEKQKAEARRLEEERREAKKKENERRIMEEEERNKELEEEKRKQEAERGRERKEAAVLAAIEEAKREAEKLRKAKLYKHVLDDDENSVELEHSILGFDDTRNQKILKEIESMERQKKYDMQTFEKKPKVSAKKIMENVKADEQYRRFSLNDERPIKKSARNNRTFSDFADEETPIGFTRRGRQSLRLPSLSQPKHVQKARSSSAERRLSKSPEAQKSGVRRPSLHCAIPVRPQRRIPPPSIRPRCPSVNDDSFTFLQHAQIEEPAYVIAPHRQSPCLEAVEKNLELLFDKNDGFEPHCDFPISTISLTERFVHNLPQLKPITTTPLRPTSMRRSSHDALSFLSDIPTSDEKKMSSQRRMSNLNEDSFSQNPLFQPVATRCRRSRIPMENPDVLHTSPSSSSGSPAAFSQEISSSPTPSIKMANKETNENMSKFLEKPSPTERPTVLVNDSSSPMKSVTNEYNTAAFTPFRKKLANTNALGRHREEEFLSPEIKRKGECPQSSSLRSSLANLSVDGSDDGRLSPVSPLIQRFNSKTSQYRSLNLKKTSERNQQILERLAQIRARLPQNQMGADKDACRRTFFTRSPRQIQVHETPRKSSESVTAV